MSDKKPKPTLEEIAPEWLEGNNLKNILDFYEFLKNNKLGASKTASYTWTTKHKGKKICSFKFLSKDCWLLDVIAYRNFTNAETYEKYITAEQKKFLLDNIRTPACRGCKGRDNIEFFGQIFNNVCNCGPHAYNNPEGEVFEYLKQITLANKKLVSDIAAAENAAK